MELGDLLDTAHHLCNLLRGIMGSSSALAHQLGTTPLALKNVSLAAQQLDQFLKEIEDYDEPMEVLSAHVPPPSFTPIGDDVFEEISLSQANTFDEVLAAVAKQMHQAAKNLSEEADNIAKELATFAKATRGGNKHDMLVAAKSASVFIVAFCKELEDLGNKIPRRNNAEKREQDNIFRYQQALRNYGTQLKILSSVKAASIEESRDTDATLTVLSRNLGDVVQASLQSMAIVRDAIFGGKAETKV